MKQPACDKEVVEKINLAQKASNDVCLIAPERLVTSTVCQCTHKLRSDVERICDECYLDLHNEEIEVCLASEDKIGQKKESSKNFKAAMIHLNELYNSEDNVKVVVTKFYQMPSNSSCTKTELDEHFEVLLKDVKGNKNCECFYCQAKDDIPFITTSKEPCMLTKEEERRFLPKESFHASNYEEVKNTPDLDRYCATFLSPLHGTTSLLCCGSEQSNRTFQNTYALRRN